MFESMSLLETRAKRLLVSYDDFVNGGTATIFDSPEEHYVGSVRAMKGEVEGYARAATALTQEGDFATLDTKLQNDIRAVAEESATGARHIEDTTHHETIWSGMDDVAKQDATHRQLMPRQARAALGEILRLKRREHSATTALDSNVTPAETGTAVAAKGSKAAKKSTTP